MILAWPIVARRGGAVRAEAEAIAAVKHPNVVQV